MKIRRPDRYIQWPEKFGRRFIISVDTEEEFDWGAPFQRSGHTTVSVPMLRKFQEFVEKYGVCPAYFVDYSIISDDEAVAFLRNVAERKTAEIGVHLHPWVNPPFDEEVNVFNSFAGNLPWLCHGQQHPAALRLWRRGWSGLHGGWFAAILVGR